MSKSTIIAVVVIVLAVVGGGAFLLSQNNDSDTNNTANTTPSPPTSQNQTDNQNDDPSDSLKTYTKAEVATHNTSSDCWTIISGKVYDLTSYVSQHSGGDEILRACGIDGTTLFTQRHTASGESVGTGTPHSEQAQNDLSGLLIGSVSD